MELRRMSVRVLQGKGGEKRGRALEMQPVAINKTKKQNMNQEFNTATVTLVTDSLSSVTVRIAGSGDAAAAMACLFSVRLEAIPSKAHPPTCISFKRSKQKMWFRELGSMVPA